MSRNHIQYQHGFILLPVVTMLFLVASVAYLMNRSNSIERHIAEAEAAPDHAHYALQAAETHFKWLSNQLSCVNYPTLSNMPIGDFTYNSTPSSNNGSPISVTFTTTDSQGLATTRVSSLDIYQLPTQDFPSLNQDTYLNQAAVNLNYGKSLQLKVDGQAGITAYPVLLFDLLSIPSNAQIVTATLTLNLESAGSSLTGGIITAYPMSTGWTEGSGNGQTTGDGATFNSSNGINAWSFSSSYATSPSSSKTEIDPATLGDYPWDVTTIVQQWVSNSALNKGITLMGNNLIKNALFSSNEGNAPPHLTVTYRLECGAATAAPSNDVTVTLSMLADATINKTLPDLNDGASAVMSLGNISDALRLLIQTDVSSIPAGALIKTATLNLFLEKQKKDSASQSTPLTVNAYMLLEAWDEGTNTGDETFPSDGVTWNNRTLTEPWGIQGGKVQNPQISSSNVSLSAAADWVTWDVTSLVQEWIDGISINHGMLLKTTHGNTLTFSAQESSKPAQHPKLEVVYTPP